MDTSSTALMIVTNAAPAAAPASPRRWLRLNVEGCWRRFPSNNENGQIDNLSQSTDRQQQQPTVVVAERRTRLNPSAEEWNPFTQRAPEEERCLFLTFSNGYPLSETQIIQFFTNKFGPCVERVYIHSPDPRSDGAPPPLFGKVVFKASYIPAVILCGEKQSKFMVDGKPLWCKKFEPKKKQANANLKN